MAGNSVEWVRNQVTEHALQVPAKQETADLIREIFTEHLLWAGHTPPARGPCPHPELAPGLQSVLPCLCGGSGSCSVWEAPTPPQGLCVLGQVSSSKGRRRAGGAPLIPCRGGMG